MVICLERGADLHTVQLMPLPLTVACFSEVRIGFSLWYWLTRVVLDKGLIRCVGQPTSAGMPVNNWKILLQVSAKLYCLHAVAKRR